ncbi:hypothetical protein [Roseovarius aestuarii]|uniref:hypothetical protein n=1 Tax=Roseovarius aestuarii TaxID=475083 RepID=UPI001CBC833E|nr:hypothetical protein [Roseovarius aestuarii]
MSGGFAILGKVSPLVNQNGPVIELIEHFDNSEPFRERPELWRLNLKNQSQLIEKFDKSEPLPKPPEKRQYILNNQDPPDFRDAA